MTYYKLQPATMADIEDVVTLCNRYDEAQGGPHLYSIEKLSEQWTAPGFDLTNAIRLARTPKNELVGFASVRDTAKPPVKPRIHFCVHPKIEGTELSTCLLNWVEKRSCECLQRVDPDIRVAMGSSSLSTFSQRKQQLEAAGFSLIRHIFHMQILLDAPPPAPVWPDHITLHHYATKDELFAHLPEIITAVEEAFQDHFGHVDRPLHTVIKEWKHRLQNDSDFDPRLWFVARDGADIAGNVLCWPRSWEDEDEGYIGILSVRRPWRRQGLAKALLHHAFLELYRLGQRKVGLGVDAASLTGAVNLYKNAGMSVLRQFDIYEKELRPGRDITTR